MDSIRAQDAYQSIFDWDSPLFYAATARRTGKGEDLADPPVRLADFYDCHLSPTFTLKRIVHTKDLHRRIAHLAEQYVRRRLESGPSTDSGWMFFQQGQRRGHMNMAADRDPLVDAAAMQTLYERIVITFCLPVASSLFFQTEELRSVLEWGESRFNDDVTIGSPSLQVNNLIRCPPEGSFPTVREVLETAPAETRERLMHSIDALPHIATWEIKSLFEGTKDAFFALQLLAAGRRNQSFAWDHCGSRELKTSSSPSQPLEIDRVSMLDSAETIAWVSRPWEDTFARREDRPCASSSSAPVPSAPSTDAQFLNETLEQIGSSLQIVEEMDNKSWSRLSSDTASRLRDALSPKDFDFAANNMLQQVWAESVRQNTTVLVLHAGNFEFVGIRHRASQTLYLSDLLHPPSMTRPGYGQVQIGLYLLALEDMFRRVALLSTDDLEEIRRKRKASSLESPSVKRQRLFGKDGESLSHKFAEESLTVEACRRKSLVVTLRYEIYDSPSPSLFHRSSIRAEGISLGTEPGSRPVKKDLLHLTLHSLIGHGATGVVHSGILVLQHGRRSSKAKTVAKLAFSAEQRQALAREHALYQQLHDRGVTGIPTCYGLFVSHDHREPACLLLSFAGTALTYENSTLSEVQKARFLDIIKSIHAAGILHDDIRPSNLMVDDNGEPVVIDFGHAHTDAAPAASKREYSQLAALVKRIGPPRSANKAGPAARSPEIY